MTEVKKNQAEIVGNENKDPGDNSKNVDQMEKDLLATLDEGKDNAIQNLIYYSFYPATCIVPLAENLISIKEKVPELMKAKEHDPILQETITTFHTIMKEKEDEILNLRRQINNSDSAQQLAEVQSTNTQTDLTLDECNEMERHMLMLAGDVPERKENSNQLDSQNDKKSLQPGQSKLEEDLEEAYKNLMELEEKNAILQKQVLQITETYKGLQYKFDDINELKMEIEDAKIQAEDELWKLKQIIKNQDDHLKEIKEKEGKGSKLVSNKEIDIIKTAHEDQIKELERKLQETPGQNRVHQGESAVDDILVELKEIIYKKSSNTVLLPFLPETFIKKTNLDSCTDKEIIEKIITICCDEEQTEHDVVGLVALLKSISYKENGEINTEEIKTNITKFQNIYEKMNKENVIQEAILVGLQLNIANNLNKMEMSDLKKEYMKLENILNIINTHFNLTQLGVINRMSRKDLVDGIIEKMLTILEIVLHSFWNFIFNDHLKDHESKQSVTFTNMDQRIVRNSLFPGFQTKQSFKPFMSMIINIRNILLNGESSRENVKEDIIFFMKLYGGNIIYDINNHILPKYPKEIRCKLMETFPEDTIVDMFKIQEQISPEFLSYLTDSMDFNMVSDPVEKSSPHLFSWFILDCLSAINFESELFFISTNAQKLELPGHVLSISNATKKLEKSLIKVSVQKDIRNKLLECIGKIQLMLNTRDTNVESYKAKTELELCRLLIKKKEMVLKLIFKDTFVPVLEKIPLSRNSQFFSCVSKEKINVDFWIKMVLDKYQKEQIKELQNLTEEDLSLCVKRLLQTLELLSPSLGGESRGIKTGKNGLIKQVIACRNHLMNKLQECFVGQQFPFQFNQDSQDMSKMDVVFKPPESNEFHSIMQYFGDPPTGIQSLELNDVLKRLYNIDCELFPGISFQEDIHSRKLHSGDILKEIIYLRLAIACNMIYLTESLEKQTLESEVDRWAVMKKIESEMFNSDLISIDKDLIDSERNLITKILRKCKISPEANEDKLKKAFLEIKKISCRNNMEMFNIGENGKYFDKILKKEDKLAVICEEVRKIMNSFRRKVDLDNQSENLVDKYMKLDTLLEDMEISIPKENESFHNTWIYSVHEKVVEIKSVISNGFNKEGLGEKSMRDSVEDNLDDIHKWVLNVKKLQASTFIRLNNAVRKLSNVLPSEKRNVKLSPAEKEFEFDNTNEENRALEMGFVELEERINEIGSKSHPMKYNIDKIIENKISNKNDEELRRLVSSLENELSRSGNNKTRIPLDDDRSRKELEADCFELSYNLINKNLEQVFKYESHEMFENGRRNEYEDINQKLMQYQDLCDSVDRLKIPQLNSKEKSSPQNSVHEYIISGVKTKDYKARSDVMQSPRPQSNYVQNYEDENIDLYFQKRLNDLRNYGASLKTSTLNSKDTLFNVKNLNGSEIFVDGFDIEDEKTSRYYSMRLQDIQHERKEDELTAILYQMDQQRLEILERNKNLQQQLFVSQNVIENQKIKLESFEKLDKLLKRHTKTNDGNEKRDNNKTWENTNIMNSESKRLTSTLNEAYHQLDQQNTKLINFATLNNNLLHENSNLEIKNKHLQRSFMKLEELYKDLIHQLDGLKQFQVNSKQNKNDSVKDVDTERKFRQSEKDKMELVKKLDIIDQQNKLLKDHCEKLDYELSNANKRLAESQDLAEDYHLQVRQLTGMLDGMKSENDRYQSMRGKDEDVKRLTSKIRQLETKLMAFNKI